jgi:hypothetical protein
MAQLYPRARGSLFVASYNSQGSGGGILTRLHTGLNAGGAKSEPNLSYYLDICSESLRQTKKHFSG